MIFGQPDKDKIVLGDNGNASFLALRPIRYMLPFFEPVERDYQKYVGEINPLPKVQLSESL